MTEPGTRSRLDARFGRVLGSASAANFGDGIRVSAFPLLAVTMTTDPVVVAALVAMEFLPWVLFGVIAGAIADRFDHRRLMMFAGFVRAAAVTLLVLALLGGQTEIWLVYLVAFVFGIGEALYDTATLALIPRIVDEQNLPRANSLVSTTWTTFNEFLGPVAGAKMFAFTRSLPFIVQAAAMYVSSLVMAGRAMRQPHEAGQNPRPLSRQVREGFRTLATNAALRTVVLASAAVAAADTAWFAVLVLYVTEVLDASTSTFGVLLAISAFGGIAGGLAMERIGSRFRMANTLIIAVIGLTGAQITLAMTSSIVVAAVMLLASSAALAVWNIVAMTIRQRYSTSDVIGRVTGISRSIVSAAAAVAAVLGGIVADVIGVRATFVIGLPVVLLMSTWAVLMLRRSEEHDDASAG